MTTLSSYKKTNQAAFAIGEYVGQKSSENFNLLFKILKYKIGGTLETNFIIGETVGSKEIITIRLEQIVQKENSKYKRIEIADFLESRNRTIPIGCYMVSENTKINPDGTYSSRWLVPLGSIVNETRVIIANAKLRTGVSNGKEWFVIDILIPTNPKLITSMSQFDETVISALTPRFSGSKPAALIRITDNEGAIFIINIQPKTIQKTVNSSTFKVVSPYAVESLEAFKSTEKDKYKMIRDLILDATIKIELILLTTLYPGLATKEKMEAENENKKLFLQSRFKTENNELGYVPCIIATRKHQDNTPYLTYIMPTKFLTKASIVDYISIFKF